MTLSTQSLVLPVRQYYVQTDSQLPGQALRMCFSSTCAMAVKYLQPKALLGPNADDAYLRTVQRYGDTTSPEAQIAACADFGVVASFRTDGTQDQLLEELEGLSGGDRLSAPRPLLGPAGWWPLDPGGGLQAGFRRVQRSLRRTRQPQRRLPAGG